jgi:EAL domain-containing protein (putative c-di-GMP-specific phosphodiesterase class I)/GGDEF domain-containing protein
MEAVRGIVPEDTGRLEALRRERDRFVALAFCAADMLFETDSDHRIAFAAGATVALTGRTPEGLIGSLLEDLIAAGDRAFVAELLGNLALGQRLDPVLAHLDGPEGLTPPLLLSGYHLPDMPGRYFFALKLGAGAIDPELRRALARDPESSLLDKNSFARVAALEARAASRAGEELKLTMFRLDRVAALRARIGAEAHRTLAATIGACLRANSAAGESAGRLAEDSYGLLHKPSLDVERIRRRIQDYARDADPEGAGVAVSHGTLAADVARLADGDALRAVQYALDRFCAGAPEAPAPARLSEAFDSLVGETTGRMTALRRIIAEDAFEIAFQPIVEIATRRIHHFEALARFSPDRVDDSPYEMITFAEATGLICDFDLAMCRKVLAWLDRDGAGADAPARRVAANLSGRSLGNVSFVAALHDLLDAYPQSRPRLIFEITESARIADLDLANRFIQSLRLAGHRVCLDDFGAGSSAFHYLRALEVDVVKIDGAYIRSAVADAKAKAFLMAMAGLCHALKVEVIAEMVEERHYLPLLEECGIRYAQGYLFGRPDVDVAAFDGGDRRYARRFRKR